MWVWDSGRRLGDRHPDRRRRQRIRRRGARHHLGQVGARLEGRKRGDVEEAILYYGQSSALIDEVAPAARVVAEMVSEAETILRQVLPGLVVDATSSS